VTSLVVDWRRIVCSSVYVLNDWPSEEKTGLQFAKVTVNSKMLFVSTKFLRDVKDSTLSKHAAHRWLQECQHHSTDALYSPETLYRFWYSFLLEVERSPGPSAAERTRYIGELISSGLEPETFRLVAWCLNHYATAHVCITQNFCQSRLSTIDIALSLLPRSVKVI
jgi:hypothetical protein